MNIPLPFRTDTVCMTRRELLSNSARLTITAFVVSLPLVVIMAGLRWWPKGPIDEHRDALAVAGASGFLALSLLCAAGYHALRGLCRPTSYQPPSTQQLCAREETQLRKPAVRVVVTILGLALLVLAVTCFVAAAVEPMMWLLGSSAALLSLAAMGIGLGGRFPGSRKNERAA